MKNRAETVALYWACQWLGAWFVPLNHRLGPDEAAYCVEDAGAPVIAFDAAGAEAAHAVAGDRDRTLLAVADGDGGDTTFADLCAADPGAGALDLDDGEISLMLYTSGTTGRPKGVPRSHRADRAGGLTQVAHHGLDIGDRTLGVMPLYHTMGMHSMIAMALIGGCFVALAAWSPGDALRLVEEERLTSLYLAPTFYHDLLDH
jgi:2-furoate---CoA ligase